jgi:hypothetical protein
MLGLGDIGAGLVVALVAECGSKENAVQRLVEARCYFIAACRIRQ